MPATNGSPTKVDGIATTRFIDLSSYGRSLSIIDLFDKSCIKFHKALLSVSPGDGSQVPAKIKFTHRSE